MTVDGNGSREILYRAVTGPDGRYGFRNLDPGTYEAVVLAPPPHMSSTTPLNMHVLLTRDPGGTGSFLEADFGFAEELLPVAGPRLDITGSVMRPWTVYRGESFLDLWVPPELALHFAWQGFADPGLQIKAYRWGWDVIDPDDPNDIGWYHGVPGLGPAYQEAIWGAPLEPGSSHRLVIHCWDTADNLTRAIIQFRVEAPD